MPIFRKKGTPTITGGPPAADAMYMGAQYHISDMMRPGSAYWHFRNAIQRMIFSNFKWEGCTPEESQFIERELIMKGRIAAVKTTTSIENKVTAGVYFGIPSIAEDTLYDFYGQPKDIGCVGLNGAIALSYNGSWALGYDTTCTTQLSPMIPPIYQMFDKVAENIYNAFSAWRVACETSKSAMIIGTDDDKGVQMITKALKRVTENDPYVVLKQPPMTQNLTVNFRNNTDHVKVFYDNYINTIGAFMDLLGCPNAAPNKHERMIVGELEMNQSFARYIAEDRLRARDIFAEKVKEKCGKTIKPVNNLEAAMEAMQNEQMDSIGGMERNPVSDSSSGNENE